MAFEVEVVKMKDGTAIHVLHGATKKEFKEYAESLRAVENSYDGWEPANAKVFMADLRQGIAFCANKYGVSEATIREFVSLRVPHLNLDIYGVGNG